MPREATSWRGKLCNCHSMRLWRMEHPVEAHFAQIRDRARRREIPFTITLDDYREAIAGTEYTNRRGRRAWNLHIDRRDALKGYEPGNIRVMLAAANCAKGATTDKARRRAYVEQKLGIKLPVPASEPEPPDEWDAWYDEVNAENAISDNCPF